MASTYEEKIAEDLVIPTAHTYIAPLRQSHQPFEFTKLFSILHDFPNDDHYSYRYSNLCMLNYR